MPLEKVFVPHICCTVASGDCFSEGRCLNSCRRVQKQDQEKRLKEFERKLIQIQMTVFDLERKITILTKDKK